MIEFSKLNITNFGCIKTAELQLNKQGLVLVLGENQDTTAASSNGAGKSTLLKALSWVLFGRTVDGSKGDEIICKKTKKAEVSLEFKANEVQYSLTRSKAKDKSEKLKLFSDGESFGSRTIKDAQVEFENILNLDWLSFKNTVLYGQGDINHFADPRTTDSQRKAVLTKILRLERLDLARKEARRRRKENQEVIATLNGKLSVLHSQLENMDADELKESENEWNAEKNERTEQVLEKLEKFKQRLKSFAKLEKKLNSYKKHVFQVKDILIEYEESTEKKRKFEKEIVRIRQSDDGSKARYMTTANHLEKQIALFNDGSCPTCGTPIGEVHIDETVDGYKEELKKLKKQIQDCETQEEFIQNTIEGFEETINIIDSELEEEAQWKEKLETINENIIEIRIEQEQEGFILQSMNYAKEDFEKLKAEVNPYTQQIKVFKKQRQELKSAIDEKKISLAKENKACELNDFWIEGFGPQGLSSYLMDSVVPVISKRTNSYLEILSDGDLQVELDTLTTLKGGNVKDQLEILTTVEGQEGVPLSGGQMKKVTLACDLALMDLLANREGAAINLLLLDEVLDGVDEIGKARVMNLLEYLRTIRSTVMVISHDSEIVEKFSKVITIVKKNGVAKLKS